MYKCIQFHSKALCEANGCLWKVLDCLDPGTILTEAGNVTTGVKKILEESSNDLSIGIGLAVGMLLVLLLLICCCFCRHGGNRPGFDIDNFAHGDDEGGSGKDEEDDGKEITPSNNGPGPDQQGEPIHSPPPHLSTTNQEDDNLMKPSTSPTPTPPVTITHEDEMIPKSTKPYPLPPTVIIPSPPSTIHNQSATTIPITRTPTSTLSPSPFSSVSVLSHKPASTLYLSSTSDQSLTSTSAQSHSSTFTQSYSFLSTTTSSPTLTPNSTPSFTPTSSPTTSLPNHSPIHHPSPKTSPPAQSPVNHPSPNCPPAFQPLTSSPLFISRSTHTVSKPMNIPPSFLLHDVSLHPSSSSLQTLSQASSLRHLDNPPPLKSPALVRKALSSTTPASSERQASPEQIHSAQISESTSMSLVSSVNDEEENDITVSNISTEYEEPSIPEQSNFVAMMVGLSSIRETLESNTLQDAATSTSSTTTTSTTAPTTTSTTAPTTTSTTAPTTTSTTAPSTTTFAAATTTTTSTLGGQDEGDEELEADQGEEDPSPTPLPRPRRVGFFRSCKDKMTGKKYPK